MKNVIYIDKGKEKGIEFTDYLNTDEGWSVNIHDPSEFERIVYLGKCNTDGDMFACYDDNNNIEICKGHLNNGTY